MCPTVAHDVRGLLTATPAGLAGSAGLRLESVAACCRGAAIFAAGRAAATAAATSEMTTTAVTPATTAARCVARRPPLTWARRCDERFRPRLLGLKRMWLPNSAH
jgi:hypothetical protein